jgi:thioredoxin 1
MDERSVIELDDSNWENLVEKEGKPMVVMFYNPTCPHCMAMMPYFEKYAAEFKGKISFARINVNSNPYAVSRYGIMATPTFKFFRSGRPVQELWGRYILQFSRRLLKMRWSMQARAPQNQRL